MISGTAGSIACPARGPQLFGDSTHSMRTYISISSLFSGVKSFAHFIGAPLREPILTAILSAVVCARLRQKIIIIINIFQQISSVRSLTNRCFGW